MTRFRFIQINTKFESCDRQTVKQSHGQSSSLLIGLSINKSVIPSGGKSISSLIGLSVSQLVNQSVSYSAYHSSQSVSQSVKFTSPKICHLVTSISVVQSIRESAGLINHSINQSVHQAVKHLISQPLSYSASLLSCIHVSNKITFMHQTCMKLSINQSTATK